ncbi:MAG TPA: diiron oxygenase [Blastocatellia bacterium]|nr:diiron oxygenase [Blastocatellia bacterium]
MINESQITESKYHHYTYRDTLAASEKIRWRVEDIIGRDQRLDFTKPFMPEALARVEQLGFLTPAERLVLNQIRGNGYLCLFGLLEEVILPFVLDHARARLDEDEYSVRAFLQFASEEAKHIHLFRRFSEEFERGFGTQCALIGPSAEVAPAMLSHHPLAVALIVLQGEWMSQRHYIESVRDNQDLDPLFKSLLKHHWMEEAQHAKLDTLMVEEMAAAYSRSEIEGAFEEYFEIASFLDGGFKQQAEFDLESLTRATGRTLSASDRQKFIEVQHQAYRWTFIGSGMTHENFLATLESIDPALRRRAEEASTAFC